ncbi:MAG: DUF2934 domain-containing protein [Candidatus Obscuribacterales bacterium]|nr:DUF2934 domain-containing protein [Candidatus Obscuribacterales bacterium]
MAKIASKSIANKRAQQQTTTRRNIQEEIRAKAYGLWLKRGKPLGDALKDWLAAERELT